MNNYRSLTVVPAYGADYRSQTEARQAWRIGKDFRIRDIGSAYDGRYVSSRDVALLRAQRITHVHIRYARLERIAVIKVSA